MVISHFLIIYYIILFKSVKQSNHKLIILFLKFLLFFFDNQNMINVQVHLIYLLIHNKIVLLEINYLNNY